MKPVTASGSRIRTTSKAPTDSQAGGLLPVWPEGEQFRLNFDFEPLAFVITDGDQEALALFNPISYGADPDQAIYAVDGTYTFADTGETRRAQLHFKGGESLFQVFGFVGSSTTGAPSEITPRVGDTFTVSLSYMDLDQNGKVKGISTHTGDTITFTGKTIRWENVYLPDGKYLVGVLISDHDGNVTPPVYTEITVR